jgi:ferric-dicitrate binding protein FerR (iron transport regulator)
MRARKASKRAEDAFTAREEFETRLADGSLAPDPVPVELPTALAAPLRALRRRLNLGIALYAALMVGTGVFNALHGGQLWPIVGGVALNLLWVSQLVGSILQRRAAMAPVPGMSLNAWRDGLLGVVAGRERVLLSPALADGFALGALRASRKLANALEAA